MPSGAGAPHQHPRVCLSACTRTLWHRSGARSSSVRRRQHSKEEGEGRDACGRGRRARQKAHEVGCRREESAGRKQRHRPSHQSRRRRPQRRQRRRQWRRRRRRQRRRRRRRRRRGGGVCNGGGRGGRRVARRLKAHTDPASGKTYYYSKAENQTTWTRPQPPSLIPVDRPSNSSQARASAHSQANPLLTVIRPLIAGGADRQRFRQR